MWCACDSHLLCVIEVMLPMWFAFACDVFAQVAIAMAHHDYLNEEGGQLMVEFVVKQCALAPIDMQVGHSDRTVPPM